MLRGLYFQYTPGPDYVLRDINLEIKRGERVGLIGTTGSGKSTLIDIIMGLLTPKEGNLMVDDVKIVDSLNFQKLENWRATVAHVPQAIYLADSSIAENIAFGFPRHEINMDRVKQCAESAQISTFIETCPQGYDTFVGERGIRLSGGQRQRIGIARALYKQAQVIVFDEATECT